jgi:hypothetical protein
MNEHKHKMMATRIWPVDTEARSLHRIRHASLILRSLTYALRQGTSSRVLIRARWLGKKLKNGFNGIKHHI